MRDGFYMIAFFAAVAVLAVAGLEFSGMRRGVSSGRVDFLEEARGASGAGDGDSSPVPQVRRGAVRRNPPRDTPSVVAGEKAAASGKKASGGSGEEAAKSELVRRWKKCREAAAGLKRIMESGKKIVDGHYEPDARLVDAETVRAEGSSVAGAVKDGDVFIEDIKMIDQGDKAYCAVATAVRLLSAYGIEMDEDTVAAAMMTSEVSGTTSRAFESVLASILSEHGLSLALSEELTRSAHSLQWNVDEYNDAAERVGEKTVEVAELLKSGGTLQDAMTYAGRHEMNVGSETRAEAFSRIVTESIDSSDPIAWGVTTGLYDESPDGDGGTVAASDGAKSGHMRMIIGYNTESGEILFTDSWGEGHELKRMPAEVALTITDGLYFVTGD